MPFLWFIASHHAQTPDRIPIRIFALVKIPSVIRCELVGRHNVVSLLYFLVRTFEARIYVRKRSLAVLVIYDYVYFGENTRGQTKNGDWSMECVSLSIRMNSFVIVPLDCCNIHYFKNASAHTTTAARSL